MYIVVLTEPMPKPLSCASLHLLVFPFCFPYYPYPCLRQAHANGVYCMWSRIHAGVERLLVYILLTRTPRNSGQFLMPQISCYFFKNDINIIRKRVLRMSYSDAFTITLFIYLFGVRLWIGSLFSNVCREDWRPKEKICFCLVFYTTLRALFI